LKGNVELKKLNVTELIGKSFIVYGAGRYGMSFVSSLLGREIYPGDITIWDENAASIISIFDIPVEKPFPTNTEIDKTTLVVIALSPKKNAQLLPEVRGKFETAGYSYIYSSDDISFVTRCINASDTSSLSYQDCEYEDDHDFSDFEPKIKALAYYLPQFHEIPENAEWWGEGFTEWTNVKKAKPLYPGHYQPRFPHKDIGYYDLSNVDTIKRQALFSKRHGLFGWCMYYYWFAGKKLLYRPLDLLLGEADIDINFCLFWVNEDWTRGWVGRYQDILIKSNENDDPIQFVRDISKYVNDPRYIRIGGKPVLLIDDPQKIKNRSLFLQNLQECAISSFGEAFYLVSAAIGSPKSTACTVFESFTDSTNFRTSPRQDTIISSPKGNILVSTYDNFMTCARSQWRGKNIFPTIRLDYDSTCRNLEKTEIFNFGFSREKCFNYIKSAIENAASNNKDLIFVFAFNEWAESAYLEPDERFGYMMANTLSKALCGLDL
jgi:hypothetical protein